jgi:hypothetical protein
VSAEERPHFLAERHFFLAESEIHRRLLLTRSAKCLPAADRLQECWRQVQKTNKDFSLMLRFFHHPPAGFNLDAPNVRAEPSFSH